MTDASTAHTCGRTSCQVTKSFRNAQAHMPHCCRTRRTSTYGVRLGGVEEDGVDTLSMQVRKSVFLPTRAMGELTSNLCMLVRDEHFEQRVNVYTSSLSRFLPASRSTDVLRPLTWSEFITCITFPYQYVQRENIF